MMELVQRLIQNAVAPLQRRVRLMVSRAIVTLVNDELKCQGVQVQLLAGEVQDDVEHVQPYGFTSHPLEGAEAIFLAIGGNRSHGVVLNAMNREHRPRGFAAGEVALYTHQGALLALRLGKKIELVGDDVRLGTAAANKGVGRVGDSVSVTIPAGTNLGSNSGGPIITAAPITLEGTITGGSANVKAAD